MKHYLAPSWQLAFATGLLGLTLGTLGCPGELKDPERFLSTGSGTCSDVEQDLFAQTCNGPTCHNATDRAGELDLESPGVATRISGVPGTVTCMSAVLADPANPEQSLLVTKLDDMPPCGAKMPFGLPPLSDEQRQCLIDYIAGLTPGPTSGPGGGGGMGGAGNAGGMGGMGAAGGAGGAGGN